METVAEISGTPHVPGDMGPGGTTVIVTPVCDPDAHRFPMRKSATLSTADVETVAEISGTPHVPGDRGPGGTTVIVTPVCDPDAHRFPMRKSATVATCWVVSVADNKPGAHMSVQAINRRFRTQHGLISRQQALIHLTSRQIEGKLGSGEWYPERRGVYRLTAVPLTFEARCLSQTLDRKAVISHRAAAALSGLEPFTEPATEITVPYGARTRGQLVHVSSQWAHRDQLMRRGIPCTGIQRTVMDCAGVVPLPVIEIMAESAIRQGFTSWAALNEYFVCHAARGRTGSAGLRALLKMRGGSPTITRSTFSLRVARLLTNADIPAPVVEYGVRDRDGRHILALDLAWPDKRMAWELDGLEWHFGRTDVRRDKTKRNSVKAQGWAIQEILWEMYLETPDQLICWARDFLR